VLVLQAAQNIDALDAADERQHRRRLDGGGTGRAATRAFC
jgi:hypothetical protein